LSRISLAAFSHPVHSQQASPRTRRYRDSHPFLINRIEPSTKLGVPALLLF
jgi:hypothetical protein